MAVFSYLGDAPEVGAVVDLHRQAAVVGKVHIAGPAVFEAHAVARGDQNAIRIGPRFHLGERSTVHVELDRGTEIGADVWVGADAVIHATTLGDGVRVEDQALVLSRSSVGAGSIVAADSLVTEGVEFPENSYILGTPGRRVRDTTPEEREETLRLAAGSKVSR
jgi:carbonic anhydrase/acetyltransferase-like protein (isoleucine patch superfamily)